MKEIDTVLFCLNHDFWNTLYMKYKQKTTESSIFPEQL